MEHSIGRFSELPPAPHLRAVDVGETKVLLAHLPEGLFVVGALCPHAGAPLVEGAVCGTRLVCPWHHGIFDLAQGGKLLEPPPLDPLPHYPLRIAGDEMLVELPGDQEKPGPPPAFVPSTAETVAIIGAGAGGQVAAETLRAEDFAGRVVLIGPEDFPPYDRTNLSKHFLTGKAGRDQLPLRNDGDFYRQHAIERKVGTVTLLDAPAKTLTFADGSTLRYDRALLATGGTPRTLDVPGVDLEGVCLLRSVADAERIIAFATARKNPERTRVILAGASFIGLEAASALAERGLHVTVVAPTKIPLERQLGPEIGGAIRALHEAHGVQFRLEDRIARIEGGDPGTGAVRAVVLEKSGERLPADLVVVGLGVRPATDFVRGIGRNEDGGIRVDDRLHAGHDLYAAGDIAEFPMPGDAGEDSGKPQRVRIEHWRVAQQHAQLAARNLAVAAELAASLSTSGFVPFYWTFHFGQRLNYIGHVVKWDEIIFDGDPRHPPFAAYYVREGKVRAVAGIGRDSVLAAVHELLRLDRMPPPAALRGGRLVREPLLSGNGRGVL